MRVCVCVRVFVGVCMCACVDFTQKCACVWVCERVCAWMGVAYLGMCRHLFIFFVFFLLILIIYLFLGLGLNWINQLLNQFRCNTCDKEF